jgi:hypothetical protein
MDISPTRAIASAKASWKRFYKSGVFPFPG